MKSFSLCIYFSVCFLYGDDTNFLVSLCNVGFNLYNLCLVVFFFPEVVVHVSLVSKYS